MIDTSDIFDNEEFVGKGFVQADLSDVIVIGKFSQPLRTTKWRHVLKKV